LLVGDYARAKRTLVDLLERMRRDGAGPVGFARVSAYLMIALSALGEVQAAEDLVPTVQAAAFGPKSMESELYVAHVVVARAKRSGHGSDAESLQPVQELLARVGTQQTKLGTAVTLLRTVLDGLDE